jgi:hypothetical protein
MPNLKELLQRAKDQEATKSKKPLSRGVRPDMLVSRGLDSNQTSEQRSQNVEITQPERSRKGGQNVEITEPKRSQEAGQNVAMSAPASTGDPTLLVGTQRRVFEYFFDMCQKFASMKTPRLTLESMASATGLTESQIHSATKQLRQKNCITLSNRKDGRGGWVEYSVVQSAFELWFRLNTKHNRSQNVEITELKRSQEAGHKAGHEAPSSSRDLYLKETTTTREDYVSGLDLSSVEAVGITQSVISRCIDLYPGLQPEKLEDLIFRFGEYIKDPKNRVQNARGFFISLAEQVSKGQIPLDHIETPSERLMREFVERKKEAKAKAQEIEQAALEFEFETWFEELTPEMKLKLVPETSMLKLNSAPHRAMLKGHFTSHVWPKRRAQIQSPDQEA